MHVNDSYKRVISTGFEALWASFVYSLKKKRSLKNQYARSISFTTLSGQNFPGQAVMYLHPSCCPTDQKGVEHRPWGVREMGGLMLS